MRIDIKIRIIDTRELGRVPIPCAKYELKLFILSDPGLKMHCQSKSLDLWDKILSCSGTALFLCAALETLFRISGCARGY
jgi:hypothetical protein